MQLFFLLPREMEGGQQLSTLEEEAVLNAWRR